MEVKWHEERFEYPLMKAIKERAEQKHVSILAAAKEVIPEYAEPLRWRDYEYDEAMRLKELDERAAIVKEYEATHSKRANLESTMFDVGGQKAKKE